MTPPCVTPPYDTSLWASLMRISYASRAQAAALKEHAVAEKAAVTFDQLHQTRTGRARRPS